MRVVIIGSGPAGITAAETLRDLDPRGVVTMVSAESYPPYSPAAMADHFITGRSEPLFWKGADVAARLGVDERRGAVVAGIDADSREVVFEDGSRLHYEGLVIASGSRLHAPLPGADLPGLLDFKSLRTAEAIVAAVRRGEVRSALVVGHGLVGIEIALLLRYLGVAVTVVGRRPWVMPRVLDPVTAAVAEEAIRDRGVRLLIGVEARCFYGRSRVEGVRLADGSEVSGDLVVASTGVKPHTEFLAGSGVDTGWGVHVDDYLFTSSAAVVAAGDVAEAADWLTGERYVHAIFPNAVNQARIAAANLLGARRRYEGAEAMNSLKHLGVPVVAMGTTEAPEEILRWTRPGCVRSVYLREGTIVGAQLAGDIRGAGAYHSLMMRRADVRSFGGHLVDPGFGAGDVVWDSLALAA